METISNEEKARTQMLLEYEKQQNAMMIAQNEFAKTRPYLNSEMGQYDFQLGFEEGVKFTKNQFIDKCKEFCDRQTTGEYYNRQGVFQIDKYIDDMLNFMKGE